MHLKIVILIFSFSFLIIDIIVLNKQESEKIKNETEEIRIAIFKCTVLEDYWELEARTGTRMKLCFSTFTSFRWFSSTKTVLFVILKTMSRLLRKNKLLQFTMNWFGVKMLKVIDQNQNPRIHFLLCTLKNSYPQRSQFWSDYSICAHYKKIISYKPRMTLLTLDRGHLLLDGAKFSGGGPLSR